jgi:hypothetical protein
VVTWPYATLLFPVGYLPLLVTDSRLLRPILLLPLALALFVVWARRLPPPRVATLAVIFVTLFVLSHVVSALTVPAVGIGVAALLFGWAAWSLADREPAPLRPAAS